MGIYKVSKRMEIAGAHRLSLPYDSKCSNLHGHNWIVTVHCKAEHLTKYGMVVDFKKIKNLIHGKFDHQYINDIVDFNPTAENMARYFHDVINDYLALDSSFDGKCYKVEVQESEGNIAIYEE